MHRDVKPHNVMIDHEQRKVSKASRFYLSFSATASDMHGGRLTSDCSYCYPAPTYRLGISRVLPPKYRIQRSSRIPLLQGPGTARRFPRIRLFVGHVVSWLYVCFNGE